MSRHLRVLLLVMTGACVMTLPRPLRAQGARATVQGTVYDSVAHEPLRGAIVQAVQLDSLARPTPAVFFAVANSRGHFSLANLPQARFAFGFQHEALRALGLESPLRVVDLDTDTGTVNLGIPSASGVRARRCGSEGMLSGYVLDAATQQRLTDATLALHWVDIERTAGSMRTVPHVVTADVSAEGAFVACGLPPGAAIDVSVSRTGYRSITGELTIPVTGLLQHVFRLADLQATRGTATLAGRMVHADGSPVTAGSVRIPALKVEAPVTNGAFSLASLPAGTWATEARAIGYQPQVLLVDLAAQTTTVDTIVIAARVQLLDAVSVVGRPSADFRKLQEVLERKRVGFGTFFLPGDERLAHALELRDLVQVSAGFRVTGGGIVARGLSGKAGHYNCSPTIYVDGEKDGPMPPMSEILAVAAYPTVVGTPVQWRDGRTCAAIAIWTKH